MTNWFLFSIWVTLIGIGYKLSVIVDLLTVV